jgi:hypothetical protein
VQRPVLILCIYRPIFSLFADGEPEAPSPGLTARSIFGNCPGTRPKRCFNPCSNSTHLPDELRYFIKEKVEGNPFYLEEVINTLIETETLDTGQAVNWQLSGSLDLKDIPTSIQGVLTARLDRLEKEAKRILQEASVIGRAFFYKVLTRITALTTSCGQLIWPAWRVWISFGHAQKSLTWNIFLNMPLPRKWSTTDC